MSDDAGTHASRGLQFVLRVLALQKNQLQRQLDTLHEDDAPDEREHKLQQIIDLLMAQQQEIHDISAGVQYHHKQTVESSRQQNRFNVVVSAISLIVGAGLGEVLNLVIRR